MLDLASELRNTARMAGVLAKAAHEAEFRSEVAEAKQVADRMIEKLPAFLQGVASRQWNMAYLVALDAYDPHQWRWPNKGTMPRHLRSIGSCTAAYRYLYGVPRHIALWALKQGMSVTIGHVTNRPEWIIFEKDKHPFYYGEQEGIIVRWL